ncbi:hypothetical protein [Nocardia bovistercoris]|uniref:Uncharacterized protein n=1 Tax=Nocardia bovistercoris TaxID=2785916 RepID=A0A931N3H9_9NOCA|nr:hypothetical protein [Nocardia bovistercoris]MBH0780650.1 hypothetical protein [Nocardia bovistercoris]
MTLPFDDPNEFPLFPPTDADDTIEALTEAIIVGDDHWFRMLAITEATD